MWQHQGQCKATWASATPAKPLTACAGSELRGVAALSLDEGVSLLLLDVVQRGFPWVTPSSLLPGRRLQAVRSVGTPRPQHAAIS